MTLHSHFLLFFYFFVICHGIVHQVRGKNESKIFAMWTNTHGFLEGRKKSYSLISSFMKIFIAWWEIVLSETSGSFLKMIRAYLDKIINITFKIQFVVLFQIWKTWNLGKSNNLKDIKKHTDYLYFYLIKIVITLITGIIL